MCGVRYVLDNTQLGIEEYMDMWLSQAWQEGLSLLIQFP